MLNLKNNIKIALRNAKKNKVLTFAKLFGISIAFAIIIFSAGYVYYETGFDKCIPGYKNIYRVIMKGQIENRDFDCAVTSSLMAKAMVNDLPDIKETVRLYSRGEVTLLHGEDKIYCGKLLLADSNFFSFFSIPIKKALKNPFEIKTNIALAKSLAIQYFGTAEGALNKVVRLGGENCIITAIFDDFPKDFHLQYKILMSLENADQNKSWTSQSYLTYFKTKTDIKDNEKLSFALTKLVYTYDRDNSINPKTAKTWEDLRYDNATYVFYFAEPLKDVHFSKHRFDQAVTANKTYVYGAIALSFLVLLISSINFINLTISNISTRIKEIGIRKTNGAFNKEIGAQFIIESLIFWIIGFIIAWGLYLTAGKQLAAWLHFDINISNIDYWKIIVLSFSGLLLFNLLCSTFPIQIISNKKILGLIKNVNPPEKYFSLKNSFVCLQFVLSAFIILSALLVQKQVNFLVTKDKGYDTENIMIMSGWNLPSEKRKTFIEDLKTFPVIKNVSTSEEFFGDDPSMTSVNIEPFGPRDYFHTSIFEVDDEFSNTFNLQLIRGRFFEKDKKSDFNSVLLNETAAKEYSGKGSVIGKKISRNFKRYEIIGIVKDFNFRSLYYKIQPLIIFRTENLGNLYIKIQARQTDKAVNIVQALWNKYKVPESLQYTFHDDVIVNQYSKDMQAKKLMSILSIISIIIACVGLYAISAQSIVKKIKEIGVRKVNGAKISEVMLMLNADFLKWVILAFCIASPIAWFLMNKWLESFPYKTNLSWWIFAFTGFIAVFVAIITVSLQSYKAATRNPVEALRYE